MDVLGSKNAGQTEGVNSWLQNLLCEKLLIDTSFLVFLEEIYDH